MSEMLLRNSCTVSFLEEEVFGAVEVLLLCDCVDDGLAVFLADEVGLFFIGIVGPPVRIRFDEFPVGQEFDDHLGRGKSLDAYSGYDDQEKSNANGNDPAHFGNKRYAGNQPGEEESIDGSFCEIAYPKAQNASPLNDVLRNDSV